MLATVRNLEVSKVAAVEVRQAFTIESHQPNRGVFRMSEGPRAVWVVERVNELERSLRVGFWPKLVVACFVGWQKATVLKATHLGRLSFEQCLRHGVIARPNNDWLSAEIANWRWHSGSNLIRDGRRQAFLDTRGIVQVYRGSWNRGGRPANPMHMLQHPALTRPASPHPAHSSPPSAAISPSLHPPPPAAPRSPRAACAGSGAGARGSRSPAACVRCG